MVIIYFLEGGFSGESVSTTPDNRILSCCAVLYSRHVDDFRQISLSPTMYDSFIRDRTVFQGITTGFQ